ncbi:MAG: TonB-dependent receptor [Candidatus Competibacter sp.]|nr:TonB-dependent receptor [Candidatus Contendobacter sp.]MDG4557685.1 TonB-dependent receptor [Candidatus Contendobacter sp.]MDS4019897.1 TonB-dependent receptor [Candidatus Competibacter sp.]
MKTDLITSMALLWGATGLFVADVRVALAADGDRDSDFPQVLTPSRLPQRLDDAPSTVTIIDRAMIEASGARRLVDVLRLVPGLQVGYKNNSLPTATYHGLSDEYARRMLLLLNGQRIFQYSRGVIEWNNLPIPLENIERIEVVRGPAAAAYGSNALQAVINIQTGSPAEYPGLSAQIAGGSDGIADGFLRYGGRVGVMDYTLSLSSVGDSGYPGVYDDRRNTSLSFMGDVPFEAGGELKLQAGFARGDYGIENPESTSSEPARDFPVTDNFQSLQWRKPGTRKDEWTLTLSHNAFHYGDRGFRNDQLLPGVTLQFDYDIEEERYEADVQYIRRFSDRWRTRAGFGYYQERVRSPFYFDTDATLSNEVSWLAGHGEYRIDPAWVLNAGAMLEYSSLTASWLFLPRFSVHYHVDDWQTLRLAYSTGSRQPTLYENDGRAVIRAVNVPLTIYRVIASGGLNPEINRSLEVGYHWQAERNQFDVRLFQEHYSDYIGTYYRPAPDVPTALPGVVLDFANDDPIIVRGLEAQWDWRNLSGTRLFASYALTTIDASGTRYDAGYEDSAPRHGLGLLASQEFGNGWQASLNYDYQSGMQWYRDRPIDGYHQLGVRLAKRFKLGSTPVTAELVGANLLGPVSDYLPNREWDRSVFLRFSLDR